MGLFATINNILFFGMAGHIYMTNYYPIQYNAFLIEAAHFCILTYSKIQIFLDRQYRNLKKYHEFKIYTDYFENIYDSFSKNSGNIEIVKDSQVFYNTTREKLGVIAPELMDFIIYSDKQESGRTNKVIYFSVPTSFIYDKCSFKFVSVTMTFTVKEHYNLKLFADKENYYIVNNRLNKYVFCYLLRKQYGIIKDEFRVQYSIEIIDQDVNMHSLTEKDEIELRLDNYIIKRFEDTPNDEYIKVDE